MAAPPVEDEDKPPCPTNVYMQVGYDYLAKGQFEKAIKSFEEAGQADPEFVGGVVATAECYLKWGKPKEALSQAHDALLTEPKNVKALLMKGEALFHTSEFEWALITYHKGQRLRPDMDGFKKGIQKAMKAIMNSIGDPKMVKLELKGKYSVIEEDSVAVFRKPPPVKKAAAAPIGIMAQKAAKINKKVQREQRLQDSPKTVKELLGDLYEDRMYLQKLLEEKSPLSGSKHSTELAEMARGGAEYLDKQASFWRHQKPLFSRKHEYTQRRKKKDAEMTSSQLTKVYLEALVDIDNALLEGRCTDAHRKAEYWLHRVDKQSHLEMPSKPEIMGSLYSSYGNALLDLGRHEEGLDAHRNDLEISRKAKDTEGIARSLDNIGRALAKLQRHDEAIKVWLQKLQMCSTMVEKTWLLHEVGRSYFDLGMIAEATEFGYRAMEAADQTTEGVWQLNARVLVAQSLVADGRGSDPQCRQMFEAALQIAKELGEFVSQDAIETALADLGVDAQQQRGADSVEPPAFPDTYSRPDINATPSGLAAQKHLQEVRDAAEAEVVLPTASDGTALRPEFMAVNDVNNYREIGRIKTGGGVEPVLDVPHPPRKETPPREETPEIRDPPRIAPTPLMDLPGPKREHVVAKIGGSEEPAKTPSPKPYV